MNLPKRKPTRLKGYDYSTPGAYFITVCVKDRKEILGKIVGYGDFDAPYNNETSKFVSLLKRYCNREYGENIWQSSCHDHIIRGEKDYKKNMGIHRHKRNKTGKDCFYNKYPPV